MLREACQMLPILPDRRAVLLTLRRPTTLPMPPSTADTISGPGDSLDERTNQ